MLLKSDYRAVKECTEFIDEYHKAFIQKVLERVQLEGLDNYYRLYNTAKRNSSEEKEYIKCQESLRETL